MGLVAAAGGAQRTPDRQAGPPARPILNLISKPISDVGALAIELDGEPRDCT